MIIVCKQAILLALLGIFISGCYIFKDIKDNDSDSGVENPANENTNNESLLGVEETDSDSEKPSKESPDSEKSVSNETDDSDSEDTGKTKPTDTDEPEPTETDEPELTDTDTKENVVSCNDGDLICEDKCVPNDIHNCGDCGHDCTALPHVGGQVDCTHGVCILTRSSCDNGWAHCSENPDDGCETNITEAINCGKCGNDCTKTNKKLCAQEDNGYECAADCTQTLCGDSCVNTDDNQLHCGKCGKECESFPNSQPVCRNGKCGIECDDPADLNCPDGCFPDDDNEHCDDCSKDCNVQDKFCDGEGNCVECLEHDDCKGKAAKLCIENECKQCESGKCCDTATKFYHSSSRICKTTTKYRCNGTGCGADAQERVVTRYCSGTSPDCDGSEVGTWSTLEACDENDLCETDGTTSASCKTCKYGCSAASGKCWSKCNPDEDPCCDGTTFFCVYDPASKLSWQEPKAPNTYKWQEAKDYCDKLSRGGHDDWKLPSKFDFIEMLGDCDSDVLEGNFGYCNSCAKSATCTALFGSDIEWYWSSSPDVVYDAWAAYFDYGYVGRLGVASVYNVRCVRSGP